MTDLLRRRVAPRLAPARPPLAGGLRHLADRLAPSSPPAAAPEGRMATEEDLRACYRLLLGREPDDSGWRGYLPYIHQRPTPVDELVGFFLASVEFRRRQATTFGWTTGAPEAIDLHAGYRIWLRPNDPSMAVVRQDRAYEPHVVDRMLPMLPEGGVMVDVGASFGYFTVLAGRAVGPSGRVVACEPGPQNQTVLLLNVVTNGLRNVEIQPVAVSDATGALLYSQSGANGAVSPFDGDASGLGSNDLVPARTLDDILGERPRLDVIKIDVEGAEGLVFAGADATLRRHRPAIFFEFSPPSLASASGVDAADLLGRLAGLGYRFEVLDADAPGGRQWEPAEILEHYGARDRDHLDLLAVADHR